MYNTNAGEHRCHAHLHCRDDRDEDLLLLPPGCSTAELPLPLVAWTAANLLDATGQGIKGQDWNATAAVELFAAITSSPSSTATIFRDDT